MIVDTRGNTIPFATKLKVSGRPLPLHKQSSSRIGPKLAYTAVGLIMLCSGMTYASTFGQNTSAHSVDAATSKTVDVDAKIREALALEKQSRYKDAIALLQPVKAIDSARVSGIEQRLALGILDRARNKFNHGEVEAALSIANKIPDDSSVWKEYQKVQSKWTVDRNALNLAQLYQSKGENALALDLLGQLSPETQRGSTAKAIRSQAIASLAPPVPAPAQIRPSPVTSEPSDNSPAPIASNSSQASGAFSAPQRVAADSNPSSHTPEWSSPPASVRRVQSVAKPAQACNDPTCDFVGFR